MKIHRRPWIRAHTQLPAVRGIAGHVLLEARAVLREGVPISVEAIPLIRSPEGYYLGGQHNSDFWIGVAEARVVLMEQAADDSKEMF